jgi:hypothetical protein
MTAICRKPLALSVLAGSLICSLAGCSSNGGPATNGPLNGVLGSQDGSTACVPARVGQPRAFGFDTFTNHGRATVVLNRVVLLRPHNERLVGSFAVPGAYVVGEAEWPPTPSVTPAWKERQRVRGFRLPPGKTFNMVLGVVATARGRATSPGMRIYYRSTTGGGYVIVDRNKMVISVTKRGCD